MGEKSPAVQVAKSRREPTSDDGIIVLSTGIRARIVPVGASLVDDAVSRVKTPKVPMVMNPEKGREEENPLDPSYIEACDAAERKRTQAALDAMILFGIELIDGLPDDDEWIKKLQFLERRDHIDLSFYDLEDSFDLEFLYKRYIATGSLDLITVGKKAGLRPQDVADAAESFRG